jgi:hypothetical protein
LAFICESAFSMLPLPLPTLCESIAFDSLQ